MLIFSARAKVKIVRLSRILTRKGTYRDEEKS